MLLFCFSYKLNNMSKIELLAPAGSLEKLKYAVEYGADAIYFGMPDFSLRVRINSFSLADLKEGIEYAHKCDKKAYVTLNIYAHNQHLPNIEKHLKLLKKLNPDGIIVSDPGIISLIKKYLPKTDIHLSTQANATNWQAVKFWKKIGVKRVILAREVTLTEIKEIRKKVPGIELEYFVHGAMCMSYSGRCILSKWMTNRSANLGDCSQPCRWAYRPQAQNAKRKTQNLSMPFGHDYLYTSLGEDKKRFNIDLEEDRHGTYFFNSYDMNLIEHVKELIDAGVDCLKIEGRAKSVYYVAVVARAYRKIIDAVETHCNASLRRKIISEQKKELDNLAHRGYSTGFLLGSEPQHNFENRTREAPYKFVGEIVGNWENGCKEGNILRVHNEIFLNDDLEAITPYGNMKVKIKKMYDDKMKEISEAHGGHEKKYRFEFERILSKRSLIRKKSKAVL